MIEMVDGQRDGYAPGTCNIGPAEIRRRRQGGYVGLVAAIALGVALILLDAPPFMGLLIAAPVGFALVGFLQAYYRFCAAFGWAGLVNFGELGEQVTVEDAQARAQDRRMALRIFALSAAGGLLAGALFALLLLV